MVVLCFVLALVLLAAALYLLWLDKKQKQQKQRRISNAPLADVGRPASSQPAAPAPAPAPELNEQSAAAQPQPAPGQPAPAQPAPQAQRPPIRPAEKPHAQTEHQPQQFQQPQQAAAASATPTAPAESATPANPVNQPNPANSDEPKRGRLGRLLSGIGQGSKTRGAGAAAGAGAVGLGAAAMNRGSNADAQAGEHGYSDVMSDAAAKDADAATTGQPAGPQTPAEGSLAAIQQQWLDARSFTEVARGDSPLAGEDVEGLGAAQRVFTGTFRGCESVVTFAGARTFVSLSRPGPATTAFIMERSAASAEGAGEDAVEQMNLRSDDLAADALLEDPRVVTALRGAPSEFQYCEVTEKWGHTSLPEDAISHYDGSIVTLHALVSAAAALPASSAGPLDLASTDPGSAAAGRSEDAEAEASLNPPRVVDAEEFDADVEDLGDDLEPTNFDETAVPFEPRKPGRAGHLRLVKSAGDDDAADGQQEPSGAAAAAAGATAAGAAGVAGVAAASQASRGDESEAKDGDSREVEADAASGVMDDDAGKGSEQAESEIAKDDATKIEPDPFESAMRSDAVPADRGDVAADFLPQRNPVPRPSRATSARYGDGEDMPALAEPAIGSHGGSEDEFKPLGGTDEDPEESRESIVEEVRRFETARTEAPQAAASATDSYEGSEEASDEDQSSQVDGDVEDVETDAPVADAPVEPAAPEASPFKFTPRPGSAGGRHRRADDADEADEADEAGETDNADNASTTETSKPQIGGSALDPDFVETTKFRAPNFRSGSHRSDRNDSES